MNKTITVFLLRSNVKSKVVDVTNELKVKKIQIAGISCKLYLKTSRSASPKWLTFFDHQLEDIANQLYSASCSAPLLFPYNDKLFALTFGHGRHLLKPGVYDERFGLMVTLNSVEPGSIRSITRHSFDTLARIVQEQSVRAARASDFGLDIEQDILRAVTGKPLDSEFAKRISGADALVASVGFTAERLPQFLDKCIKYSKSNSYKEHYPWVDQIAAVRNKEIVSGLDKQLIDRLRSYQFDNMWLGVPEVLDWSRVDGFTYSDSKKPPRQPDLHLKDYLDSRKGNAELTVKNLKRHYAYCWSNEDDNQLLCRYSIYKSMYCELPSNGATYLLSGGWWYRVEQGFVDEVNASVQSIRSPSGIVFPDCEGNDEKSYNQKLAESRTDFYFLMDRLNVSHGGGQSRIEVCDLITRNKQLIHIKRYGGSSVLSHLFSQASVSGEVLLMDEKFRDKVNSELPEDFQLPSREYLRGFEVVLGIISRSSKKLVLPFFSRVNLRSTARRLTAFGYQVSLATIRETV